MLSLLSLPNELLVQILEEVRSRDIEQLTMTCKTIYMLAGKRLERHAEMRRQYIQVAFSNKSDAAIGKHLTPTSTIAPPARILRNVLANDDIAFYPQDIIIGCLSHPPWGGIRHTLECDSTPYATDFDHSILKEVQDVLCKKLFECPYLTHDRALFFRKHIAWGNQMAIVAFLVTLLPNLRTMRFFPSQTAGHFADDMLVHDMVLQIAQASSTSEPFTPLPALSKLSTVELHRGLDVGELLSFAALPSMQSITGWRMSCRRFGGTLGTHSSGLQTIKLRWGEVKCDSLIKLICRIKALKVFSYENGSLVFQPSRILTALSEHAGHSLTHLTLTNPSIYGPKSTPADHYFGPLGRFRTLKEIDIQFDVFFKPTAEDYEVDRLVEVLPQSIETCRLSGGRMKEQDLTALMEGLTEQKSIRLPKLGEIVHDDPILVKDQVASQDDEPIW